MSEHWMHSQLFLFPRRICDLGFLTLLLCAETVGGAIVSACMLLQTAVSFSAASRHLEHTRSCQHSETEPIPWAATGKFGILDTWPNSFPPTEKMGSGVFHSLALCWARGEAMASAYMLVRPPFLFSEVLNLGDFLLVLRLRQGRNQPLEQPPQTSEHWTSGPVPFLPSQGESGSWAFAPNHVMLCWERGYGEGASQSALIWLVSCLPWVQEPLVWFLDSSQRELLVCVELFNWCAHGEKECPGLPIPPIYWHHHPGIQTFLSFLGFCTCCSLYWEENSLPFFCQYLNICQDASLIWPTLSPPVRFICPSSAFW